MTFRQKLTELLINCNMSDHDASNILKEYEDSDLGKIMGRKLDCLTCGFPDILFSIAWDEVKHTAIVWIEKYYPSHDAKLVLQN